MEPPKSKRPLFLFIIGAAWWLSPLAMGYLPTTQDWEPIFWPALQSTMQGDLPYEVPFATHPLHFYLLLSWLAPFSPHVSLVLLIGATLLILAIAFWQLTDRSWPAALALAASPLLFHLIRMGQVTGLEVAGVLLLIYGLQRESALLVSLSVIPLSAIPPNTMPLLLWGLGKRYLLPGIVMGMLILAAILALYGNWIPAWLESLDKTKGLLTNDVFLSPYRVWGWPATLALVALTVGVAYYFRQEFRSLDLPEQALFVLASTLVATPYLMSYRILPLYVLLVGTLSNRNRYLPLLLLLFSYACFAMSLQPGHLYEIGLIVPLAYLVAISELARQRRIVGYGRIRA